MRLSGVLLPLLLTVGHVCALRIATWNLRQDIFPNLVSVSDSIANLPSRNNAPVYLIASWIELPWSVRRIRMAQYLETKAVSVIGVQEALVRQVKDLSELFGSDWAWVGVGRDDGQQRGEYNAIFYNTKDVQLVSNDTFWLSKTPAKPSKYPGASSIRLATVAKFATGTGAFTVINTHLDNQSNGQRMLGASMLRVRARYEAYNGGKNDGKVFVLGDFNSPPVGTDSEGYKIATGQMDIVSAVNATWAKEYEVPQGKLDGFSLLDLRGEAPRHLVSETYATYTGFSTPENTRDWKRIDFVFGGSNRGWDAQTYTVDHVRNDDGVLMSDHRPVIVDIGL